MPLMDELPPSVRRDVERDAGGFRQGLGWKWRADWRNHGGRLVRPRLWTGNRQRPGCGDRRGHQCRVLGRDWRRHRCPHSREDDDLPATHDASVRPCRDVVSSDLLTCLSYDTHGGAEPRSPGTSRRFCPSPRRVRAPRAVWADVPVRPRCPGVSRPRKFRREASGLRNELQGVDRGARQKRRRLAPDPGLVRARIVRGERMAALPRRHVQDALIFTSR